MFCAPDKKAIEYTFVTFIKNENFVMCLNKREIVIEYGFK